MTKQEPQVNEIWSYESPENKIIQIVKIKDVSDMFVSFEPGLRGSKSGLMSLDSFKTSNWVYLNKSKKDK